jgi:aspartate racemase
MENIGILGLGSNSTLHYIRELNFAYQESKGRYGTAPFVLLNIDFDTINPYLPDQFDAVIKSLCLPLREIESFGISHLLVPNITLHETLDKIIDDYHFELIHPLQLLADELKKENVQEVVLLGTKYTMNSTYITRFLNSNSIDVLKMKENFMNQIDELRIKAYKGIDCQKEFSTVISGLPESSQIVIACTELSILANAIVKRKVYDLAQLQIKKTVEILL